MSKKTYRKLDAVAKATAFKEWYFTLDEEEKYIIDKWRKTILESLREVGEMSVNEFLGELFLVVYKKKKGL